MLRPHSFDGGLSPPLPEGRANLEVAAELFVGEATVKTHVGRVLSKLNLASRAQAVAFAYESGLVVPGTT